MVALDSGADRHTNFEVNLPADANPHPSKQPPHPGGGYPANPFAVYLEPMRNGWVRVRVEGELALDSSSELERTVEGELRSNRDVLLDLSSIDDRLGDGAEVPRFGPRAAVLVSRLPRQLATRAADLRECSAARRCAVRSLDRYRRMHDVPCQRIPHRLGRR